MVSKLVYNFLEFGIQVRSNAVISILFGFIKFPAKDGPCSNTHDRWSSEILQLILFFGGLYFVYIGLQCFHITYCGLVSVSFELFEDSPFNA